MRENPSADEHFARAEHRIFAKQKAERSAYIQLGAVSRRRSSAQTLKSSMLRKGLSPVSKIN
jgi:hypothetical protein